MLHQELQYESVEEIFWTDSKVVLGYIKNDSKRFCVFVANRVQQRKDQAHLVNGDTSKRSVTQPMMHRVVSLPRNSVKVQDGYQAQSSFGRPKTSGHNPSRSKTSLRH